MRETRVQLAARRSPRAPCTTHATVDAKRARAHALCPSVHAQLRKKHASHNPPLSWRSARSQAARRAPRSPAARTQPRIACLRRRARKRKAERCGQQAVGTVETLGFQGWRAHLARSLPISATAKLNVEPILRRARPRKLAAMHRRTGGSRVKSAGLISKQGMGEVEQGKAQMLAATQRAAELSDWMRRIAQQRR